MPVLLPDDGLSPSIPLDTPRGVPLIGYDNQVSQGMLSSSGDDAAGPVTNLANPATHLFWRAAFVTSGIYTLTITDPQAGTANYVGIAGHNFGSQAIDFQLEGITNLSPQTTVNLLTSGSPGYVTIIDDSPIIARFPANASYVGFKITLNVPGSVMPQAAVLYAGVLTALERGIKVDVTHTPITFGRNTRVINGMSESGNFLGRVVTGESRLSTAEFFGFTPDFYRNTMDDFIDFAQTDPFFWAWAPSDYPLETGFVWLTRDAMPEVSPDHRRIALTLELAGIA
jgi:hypothetical protein